MRLGSILAHSGLCWLSRQPRGTPTLTGVTLQPPADGVTPPSDAGAFHAYTLPEAARRLGIGQPTVRRMVKAGRLRAESVLRPQGTAWMVYLPAEPSTVDVEGGVDPPTPGGSARSKDPPTPPVPSAPEALTTWVVSLMAPLAEANARQHETITLLADQVVSQADTSASQAERLGSVSAERDAALAQLAALRAQNATLESPGSTDSPKPTTGCLRALVAALAERSLRVNGSTRPDV